MLKAYNWINGESVDATIRVDVVSPSHLESVVGSMVRSDVSQMGDAVNAAHHAGRAWRELGPLARGTCLFDAAAVVAEHMEELAQLAAQEMGKPLAEARGEAQRAVAILRYYAGEGARATGEVIPAAHPGTLQYTTREPLGVVGIITPWNFPLAIPVWKLAPALAYGNTAVVKPAELSSLTAYRLISLVAPLFPPGVINVVLGEGSEVGDALVRNPAVTGISFTGSSTVGQQIAATATKRGVKYQLEMGGKNPVIVAEDADLNWAVECTVSGAMRSAGQKCTATSRVIVVDEIRERFTEALVARVRTLTVGDPLDPATYLGPVVSHAQQQKVQEFITAGQSGGADLLIGGSAPLDASGWYVRPTVLGGVEPGASVAQEEIFGPVVAVLAVPDIAGAIDIANGVRYGLSASVFTQRLKTAMQCIQGLDVGMVRVNEETAGVEYQAPFGGVKASSSHSREQGRAAMEFYTETKTVAIRGL